MEKKMEATGIIGIVIGLRALAGVAKCAGLVLAMILIW